MDTQNSIKKQIATSVESMLRHVLPDDYVGTDVRFTLRVHHQRGREDFVVVNKGLFAPSTKRPGMSRAERNKKYGKKNEDS